jgi:hypothetical protein
VSERMRRKRERGEKRSRREGEGRRGKERA